MSHAAKTGLFLAVAAGAVVTAILTTPHTVEPQLFSDVGEEFFPQFRQPSQAASLEVMSFDAETGEGVPFSVKQDGGRWSIPSHHGYPADGKEGMSKAAGLLIGLRKATVRSDDNSKHGAFGVIDPLDESLELEGRGTRVTFKDSSGRALADLILGHEVDGRDGYRYVRLPGKKRTYTAVIDAEPSTKFEDWIDRDLLEVKSWDVDALTFDNYSVDETRGVLVQGEKVELSKKDGQWTLPDLDETEEVDQEKARAALDAVTGVKIVGVRPKPEGLTAQLEQAKGFAREILADQLQRRGFFLSQGKLYSNEGDLLVTGKKGVVYTLKFGEIVFGSGSKLSSGEAANAAEKAAAPANGELAIGPEPADDSHRYLMITAHFDEALLDAPEGAPLPTEHVTMRATAKADIEAIVAAVEAYQSAHDGALPESLEALTTGESPPLAELKKDPWGGDYVYEKTETGFTVRSWAVDVAAGGEGEGEDIVSDAWTREDELRRIGDEHRRHAEKVAEGKAEAARLGKRFGRWFYVIDAEGFAKMHLGRADLVKTKTPEGEPKDASAPGLPGVLDASSGKGG